MYFIYNYMSYPRVSHRPTIILVCITLYNSDFKLILLEGLVLVYGTKFVNYRRCCEMIYIPVIYGYNTKKLM